MEAGEAVDVAVVGGGPGGYYAAIHAAELGAKVVLIEEDEVGGTCLNRGCIPTIFLQRIAKTLSTRRNLERSGLSTGFHLDYGETMNRKNHLIRELVGGMEGSLRREGVTLVRGTATFLESRLVEVRKSDASRMEVAFENAIIATGSKPDPEGLDKSDGHVLTTDEVLELDESPKSLAVIGGNAVGTTLASIFHEFGAKVTVIEVDGHILPEEDEEVATLLQDFFNARDIGTYTKARVEAVDEADGEKVVHLLTEEGDKEVRVEKVLLCHRVPNTDGLGLEGVGVETEGAKIIVDERMETNVPGIYAVGDILGGSMLAHVASEEGLVAAENAVGGVSRMSYRAIPRSVYSIPELASVGLTEEKARELGYDVGIVRSSMAQNAFAKVSGETEGMVKVIFDGDSHEILGVHILGSDAFDMIDGCALAMELEATVEELGKNLYVHPSRAEALGDASRRMR